MTVEVNILAVIGAVALLVLVLGIHLCQPRQHRKTWTEPAHPCYAEALLSAVRAAVTEMSRATAAVNAMASRADVQCAVHKAAQGRQPAAQPVKAPEPKRPARKTRR